MKHDLATTITLALQTIFGTIYVLFTIAVWTLLFIALFVSPDGYDDGAWRAFGAHVWWVAWICISFMVWLGAPDFTLHKLDEVKHDG
jgi:hypothetical protein